MHVCKPMHECIHMYVAYNMWTRACSGVNLVWNLGVVNPGSKVFIFFQRNFRIMSISPQKFDFRGKNFLWPFLVINSKNETFPFPRQNMPFTATTTIKIIRLQIHKLFYFSFKSHHFPTYLLCVITYNNIWQIVHNPHEPCDPRPSQPKIWGHDTPTPMIDVYACMHLCVFFTIHSFIRKFM